MATKSFIKTINIHGNKQAKSFVKVLENAEQIKVPKIELTRSFHKANQQDIRKIFGDL